jgi:hypothetical protein
MSEAALGTTARVAINELLNKIERRFGFLFTAAALGYLTISKGGLSEAELEDALSCNDVVLDDVYVYHNPPVEGVVRIPSLMWTRVRAELASYIVERQRNQHTVIFWYHRQFVEAAMERYSSGDQTSKLHTDLGDLFGNETGVRRGIFLSKRNKLIEDADRQLGVQVLHSGNTRKLSMLPFHLVHCGDMERLKRETFCKFKFLLCYIEAFSLFELLSTIKEILSREDDTDLKLLYDSLHFSQGQIQNTASSLGGQILGQLKQYAEERPVILELCQQAQEAMEKTGNPVLIPIAGSIPSSSSALKWFTTGLYQITAISPDAAVLLTKAENDTNNGCSFSVLKMGTLTRGPSIAIPKKDSVVKCLFSRCNQRLYVLTKEEVRIFHVSSGECIQKIDVNINHAGLLNAAMAVSPSSQFLVLAGADRLGMLENKSPASDEAEYKVRRAMNFNGAIKSTNLVFSLDENLTISTHTIKGAKMVLGAVVMWDFWEKQLKTRVALPTTVEPGFLHLMPPLGGHNLVICGCHDGQIFIVDMDIGKTIVQMGNQETCASSILSVFDATENILITAEKSQRTIKVWKVDVDDYGLRTTFNAPSSLSTFTYSADTNQILAGLDKGDVVVFKLQGPSEVTEVTRQQAHRAQVTSLVCDEKEQLISCGEDGMLKLWDVDGFSSPDINTTEEDIIPDANLDGNLWIHNANLGSSDKLVTGESGLAWEVS